VLYAVLANARSIATIDGAGRQITWGDIQIAALNGLTEPTKRGDARARDAVAAALCSTDASLRSAALVVLESLPPSDAFALFDQIRNWPSWETPILLLARIADDGAETRLLAIAEDRSQAIPVRALALEQFSVRAATDWAFHALHRYISSVGFEAPELRVPLYRALRDRFADRFDDHQLLDGLNADEAIVRTVCIQMLADRYPEKDPDVPPERAARLVEAARGLLGDPDFAVRAAAQAFIDVWGE
jgi:hypothetical protein